MRHVSWSVGRSKYWYPSPLFSYSFSSTYASTEMRGSPSWAVMESQSGSRVATSRSSKNRYGGTFSTRSTTSRRVTSSQWSVSASTS